MFREYMEIALLCKMGRHIQQEKCFQVVSNRVHLYNAHEIHLSQVIKLSKKEMYQDMSIEQCRLPGQWKCCITCTLRQNHCLAAIVNKI